MYQSRHLDGRLQERVSDFKVILLTGARQVGKSTLFSHLFPECDNIVLDPLEDSWGIKNDPELFLLNHPAPLILDEIQYAPQVLNGIKRRVDASDLKGRYLLTGSQNFSMMQHVTESLAGRVCILELLGMTPYERFGQKDQAWLSVLLDEPETLKERFAGILDSEFNLYEWILRGGLPEALHIRDTALYEFHHSYLRTYLERDVRLLDGVQDLALFTRFISLMAALTAQEINFNQLGREIGITPQTAQRWLNILQAGYQWKSLEPFQNNLIKQISKRQKGYFSDTGMACHLLGFTDQKSLARHPILGALFESFCVNMVLSLNQSLHHPAHAFHYRAHGGAEVDLILAQNGRFFPIEMKCKTRLSRHDARGLEAFIASQAAGVVPLGLILYPGTECYYVTEKVLALPYLSVLKSLKK